MRKIFLTGATGFLGVHLLKDLLVDSNTQVFCLIRAISMEKAWEKIESAFKKWSCTLTKNERKSIIPILGNLEQDKLGIEKNEYVSLCNSIDDVIHTAAWVNWLLPLEALKKVNVNGTYQLIEFAVQRRLKKFYYVSSLSVFPFDGSDYYENTPIDSKVSLYGGYAQSKWVAEMTVQKAMNAGLQVKIFRPNLITGRSYDGVFNQSSYLENLVKSSIQIGYVPDIDTYIDMVPVDYVSKAIATIYRAENTKENIFHISNLKSIKLCTYVEWLKEKGYKLQTVSLENWKNKLFYESDFVNNSLYPFRQFINDLDENHTKMGLYDCQNTLDILNEQGVECPAVDTKLLNTYINYFNKIHFLN
jgi:thioester reductase-like protein